MTDASGNVTDTRTFDAFGGLLDSSGSSLSPFGFGAGVGFQNEDDLKGWIDYWRSLIMIQKEYTSLPDGGSMGTGVGAPHTKPRPMYVGIEGEGAARVAAGPIHTQQGADTDPLINTPGVYMVGIGASRDQGGTALMVQGALVEAGGYAACMLIPEIGVLDGAGVLIRYAYSKWASKAAMKALKKTLDLGADFHVHHLMPQNRRGWFRGHGIDIDHFTVILDQNSHQNVIHKGWGGGKWNAEWDEWIERNGNASADEIKNKMISMMKEYGLY